ncbi:MAG: dihydroorotase [Phycisphaerales bacterium]|nr:dihydroorotase [Phycisphaerales bacterium]
MTSLLIHGGRIIDPDSGTDATGDLLIRNGCIEAISTDSPLPRDADSSIDADGCLVTPGLVDPHVHLREPSNGQPHRETIAIGSRAALAGGFTTICSMPNTQPPPDTADRIKDLVSRGKMANAARVYPIACGTMNRAGEEATDVQKLIDAGAQGISDDGDGVACDAVMDTILQRVAAADTCFMQHCQDPTMTLGAAMNAGALAVRMGLGEWPPAAETSMIERDVLLNGKHGARYHAQHLSCSKSVDVIRKARAEGQTVTAEASPHHLLLTEEACEGYNTIAKVNPPLRTSQDIDAIKEGIAQGVITILATDQAPHPPQAKETDFASAAFGMVSIECALPLYKRALVDEGVIDWSRLIAMMTCEPANLVGLPEAGRLRMGGPADVTLIDPDLEWTIDSSTFLTTGRNCPFDGWSVSGRALASIIAGEVRWALPGARMEQTAIAGH